MALPGINFTVRDGGLGLVTPGTGKLQAKIGPCPLGVVNSVGVVVDKDTLQKLYGKGGPAPEAAALALDVAAGKSAGVMMVPVNPSTYGTASAVTHTGPGTGTMTVAIKPSQALQIRCIAGGSSSTSTWQTSTDGGVTWGATWTAAATTQLPGASFVTLAFGAGTAVTGDVVTIATTGTTALASGTGTLVPTLSSACPLDAYTASIIITAGGALGVAMFTITLDGGTVTVGPQVIPASGTYVVPDTGLVLTFSGTFTAGDTYSFTTTTASFTNTDLTNAFNAMVADPRRPRFLHVVGAASSVANAAAQLAALDALMIGAVSSFEFMRALIEVPTDTDANTLAAFAASASVRVGACAAFHKVTSTLNGRVQSRNSAWSIAARAGSVAAQEDLGRVASGSLPGVVSLQRDEQATQGLDAGRFCTLRTMPGRNGFFITNGRLFANAGSDFIYWQYGIVMDQVSLAFNLSLVQFINETVRVNSDGTIAEKDAQAIEARLKSDIINQIDAGAVVDLSVVVDRTVNVLSTSKLAVKCRAIPNGYAKFVDADVGFQNSSLSVKAAA